MLNVTARQELMRTIVETLGVVVEEARLDFGEDGLTVRVVDPSHVAMIKMDVDSAAFETWELDETKLGLEMRKLKDILSLAGPGDMVDLAYNDESGQATVNIGRIDLNLRPLENSTLIPPKVTTSERNNLAGLVAGAMVYNTSDNKVQFYNGSSWSNL